MGFLGLFGKNKQPEMRVKSAQDIFNEAMNYAKTNQPLAYGAREGAIGQYNNILADPNSFYSKYQPTSLEEALNNQYFKNVMPDRERQIKQGLSMSGMEYSPILAQLLGKAQGETSFDIGQYLSNLGQTRATQGLGIIQNQFGLDPNQIIQPYANMNQDQSNMQSSADYQNALQKYQQKQSGISSIASLIGGVGGFMVGGPAGASLGAGLGGAISPIFGGGQSPVSMADALSMYKATQPSDVDKLLEAMGLGKSTMTAKSTGYTPNNSNTNFNVPDYSQFSNYLKYSRRI